MSLFKVFDVAGSAMNAQSIRLNTVASNLANVNAAAGNENEVYKAKKPVFESYMIDGIAGQRNDIHHGVKVNDVIEYGTPSVVRYEPDHPLANPDGNVFYSNVNAIEEMVDMMAASRAFQTNVETLSTTKRMMISLLDMGS